MRKSLYRRLAHFYWRLPVPQKLKEGFIRRIRQVWPRADDTVTLSYRVNKKQILQYVEQILSIPEKSGEYVEIASDVYERQPGDPMILAYYLPQFHPTQENDEWWGRGTTEWHNVSKAVPQYGGHYQPRLPGELGYYDLRLIENIARQIELAKIHGIYGFAYYFYWFDGKRLLDKPLDIFLNDPQLDFPFCLCWANESWTRRFDGTSGEVIMHQSDSIESYMAFIESVRPYFVDNRYIRIDDRPVLIIYRPSLISDCSNVLSHWRRYCKETGLGDPYLIGVKENTFDGDLLSLGFDAQSEFHPGTVFRYCKRITNQIQFIRDDFSGIVLDYTDLVRNKKYLNFQARKLHRAVMPMWDNTARRNNSAMIFEGSTPALYKEWLKEVLYETRNNQEVDAPFVFINAWNEWGESAYLEPDRKYGYAYLRATREAMEESRAQE
jgi:lipopolysaccharide biosynthesis protein